MPSEHGNEAKSHVESRVWPCEARTSLDPVIGMDGHHIKLYKYRGLCSNCRSMAAMITNNPRSTFMRIQITTGTEEATLPTSLSSCMIFFIRAWRQNARVLASNTR